VAGRVAGRWCVRARAPRGVEVGKRGATGPEGSEEEGAGAGVTQRLVWGLYGAYILWAS